MNRYLNAAAKAISYRNIVIKVKRSDDLSTHEETINKLLDNEIALRTINHLTLTASNICFHVGPQDQASHLCQLLVDLIKRVGKLHTLTWSLKFTFPPEVLQALESHQTTARLRIFDFERVDGTLDHLDAVETALSKTPLLTHFRYDTCKHVRYDDVSQDQSEDYRVPTFKRIIATAPRLEYAGCIAEDFEPPVSDSAENEDGLPKLGGIVFRKPNSSIKALMLDGPNLHLSMETLTKWGGIIDLAGLETLKFSRAFPEEDYFRAASNTLRNLKQVSLNFGMTWGSSTGEHPNSTLQAARDYLVSCPPLRLLSLWSWMKVVDLSALLSQHASTLEVLQLHEKEGPGSLYADAPNTRKVLSVADVRSIGEQCAKLKDLTFDINRSRKDFDLSEEQTNSECLSELAKYSDQLQRVQLYFDSISLHDFFFISNENDDGEQDQNRDEHDGVAGEDEDYVDDEETEQSQDGTGNPSERSESATNSPPSKKAKTEQLQVSSDDLMRTYAIDVWKEIFGKQKYGPRLLDIKFGEWESNLNQPWLVGKDTRRFMEVMPHERDDRPGECFVRTKRKY